MGATRRSRIVNLDLVTSLNVPASMRNPRCVTETLLQRYRRRKPQPNMLNRRTQSERRKSHRNLCFLCDLLFKIIRPLQTQPISFSGQNGRFGKRDLRVAPKENYEMENQLQFTFHFVVFIFYFSIGYLQACLRRTTCPQVVKRRLFGCNIESSYLSVTCSVSGLPSR